MAIKLTYHREGDYLIPNLVSPENPGIGVWSRKRKRYLQQYKDPIYTGLLLSGTLNTHLETIDKQAEEMLDLLIGELACKEGVSEQVKAENQMAWVQKMNSIRNRAEEIILTELIYC